MKQTDDAQIAMERQCLTKPEMEAVQQADRLLGCQVTLALLEEQQEKWIPHHSLHDATGGVWKGIVRRINQAEQELEQTGVFHFRKKSTLKRWIADLQSQLRQAGYLFPLAEFEARYEEEMRGEQQRYEQKRGEYAILRHARKAFGHAAYREVAAQYPDLFGNGILTIPAAVKIKRLLAGRTLSVQDILAMETIEREIRNTFICALQHLQHPTEEEGGRGKPMQTLGRKRERQHDYELERGYVRRSR
ncbi:hypothetical protein [Ectobacillus ponti]|uniref:Uncharacterized protein n=1 Tax=Ectobacillus ponti TaxID=2961894 RepID=A0AA42BSD2_9BACI|nr:hypothetical protein [Ectobacillus ponti]MCP8970434.1 hypothetical protein [Ectobacillus ponti]